MFYVFLAEGFEETEALAPVDVMRRAKLDVKTVGVTGECVTSSHGVPVKADITIDNIDLDDDQGVVLPGGMPGTLNLEANEKVLEAVKYSCENGKIVAAICAAPSILGHLGILDGKKATCFPGFENELTGAVETDLAGVCLKFVWIMCCHPALPTPRQGLFITAFCHYKRASPPGSDARKADP